MTMYINHQMSSSLLGDGLVVSMSASYAIGRRFTSRLNHAKDHHKTGKKNASLLGTQALGLEFDGAARLSKRPDGVGNCSL